MRIVYLSSSIIPSRTANSVHVMKMSQAFARNGHEVSLLAPSRTFEEEKDINDVFEFYAVDKVFEIKKLPFINVKFMGSIVYAFGCLFAMFKAKPHLVYGRDFLSCYLAAFFFTTSYELHEPMSTPLKKRMLSKLLKRRRFKNLVVISEALKTIIIKEHNIQKDRILVAHDGADFPKDAETKIELKGNKTAIKVGYVGHLYKGKGMELISNLLPLVKSEVEFHVVGGLECDLLHWRNKTARHNNIYLYGFIPQSQLYKYINSFDICLLPNQRVVLSYGAHDDRNNISEFTSPLKMFEYMAARKAIVASDLPVLKEVLNDQNSITCDPENPEDWIRAIEALEDAHFRNILSENAYRDFSSYHTWRKRAQAVL